LLQGVANFGIGTRAVLAGIAFVWIAPCAASAQTIYPLDKAEILAGARFDLKVEFPGAPPQAGVRVTINGQDATAVLDKPATFVEREDGASHSAYWVRGAALAKPGNYTVEAIAGDRSARVNWEVYSTGGTPKAKNVILFIGDGMSVAHRTAARILAKASGRDATGAISRSTTCRTWRWCRRRAATRSSPTAPTA
jgi:alkaline phosphatase